MSAPAGAAPIPVSRRVLLAAVILSVTIGLVGGAAAAWAVYHQYGPVDRVVSSVVVGSGGSSPRADAPTYASLAAAAAPSVVAIVTHPVTAADLAGGQATFGTGFVATADGLVVTSAHAVQGATELRIAYPDGEVVDAGVAGSDPDHGIVVLRPAQSPATRPPALVFANFQQRAPRPGDLVLAVGSRALAGVTVTAGTVSAAGCGAGTGAGTALTATGLLGALQVDATASPQDDGAPLLDGAGQVVGVVADASGAAVVALNGLSASELVAALSRGQTGARASFGVQSCQLDAAHAAAVRARAGALLIAVTPGGPADIAGLRSGDVVTTVDATVVDAEHPLDPAALGLSAGQRVSLSVVRDGQDQTVSLTVR